MITLKLEQEILDVKNEGAQLSIQNRPSAQDQKYRTPIVPSKIDYSSQRAVCQDRGVGRDFSCRSPVDRFLLLKID